MAKKSKLWYVSTNNWYYDHHHGIDRASRRKPVYVSANRDWILGGGMPIRALTAKAAARKYIRYNIPYAEARMSEYCDGDSFGRCEIPEREYTKILRTERRKAIAKYKVIVIREEPQYVREYYLEDNDQVVSNIVETKETGSVMARQRAKHHA